MSQDNLAGRARDALNSDKGEQISDQGLDKAEQTTSGIGGSQHSDKIAQGRDAADKRVGNE